MKTIVVACSGGPDSMALLDMLNQKQNYNIIVCHVNYQKRESAFRDESIVKEYCLKHNLSFHLLKPIYSSSQNFQAWARDVRYDFFEQTAKEYKCHQIFVAHHMDDLIETYYFQVQRQMICDTYGLANSMIRNGMEIVRPLLGYTKKELEEYCIRHKISYGLDESNFTDHYTRNKIRHSKIEYMTRSQKEEVCKEIEIKNKQLEEFRNQIKDFLISFTVDELLDKEYSWLYLDQYLYDRMKIHFSKRYLMDLMDKLKKDICIDIKDFILERYHNHFYCEKKKEKVYYIINQMEYKKYKEFELKKEGKTIEGIFVKEEDFPLVVRNAEKGDSILLRYGTKNINRFFIDRKIPHYKRRNWLVVENCKQKIIFVPGIGCDVQHFSVNSNLFMIQYIL